VLDADRYADLDLRVAREQLLDLDRRDVRATGL